MRKDTRKLTLKEKQVLYGLVSMPHLPDSKIASEFGIPQPSFSIIKKRLVDEGLIKLYTMPSFSLFDDNTVSLLHFKYSVDLNERKKESLRKKLFTNNGEPLFHMSSNTDMISVYLTKNQASSEELASSFRSDLLRMNGIKKTDDFRSNTHSMRSISGFGLFNFKNIACAGLEEDHSIIKEDEELNIKHEEKKVLAEMLTTPGINDVLLKRKVGMDVGDIPTMRRKLKKKGACHRAYVPRIDILGFELTSYNNIKFRDKADKEGIKEFSRWISESHPLGFLISNTDTVSFISFDRSFTEHSKKKSEIHRKLEELSIEVDDIQTILLPNKEINSTSETLSFESAVKCLL